MKYKIHITLLFASVFIVLFGCLFPKDSENYLRAQFFLHKTFAPAKYNLVVLGDSRIYRGASPKGTENKLPGIALLNLGYSNGGLNPVMFRLADTKLTQNTGPRAILMGITAFTLTPESLANRHYLENNNMKREKRYELLYFGALLNWFSPVRPKQLVQWAGAGKQETTYSNRYEYGGWVASDKTPADTLEAYEVYHQSFLKQKVDPVILDAIVQQIDIWNRNGIAVFAFRPPIPKPMIDLADTLAGYNQPEIVQRITEAGGIWIDIDPSRYQTYDGSHLNSRSAIKLSEDLAAFLHPYLARQAKKPSQQQE